ncbi:hypothetical protein [Wolbachia pipientis]|uniref:hypothetical protein n=1 Tax=Wolbachia pipientis TaxID=955 RepID=UPI0025A477B0|nr:hypothetical protein [Wolbachia pipientis]MDM8335066.1 hypothetical protein [Wolbachia pipientis]
MVEYTNEVNNTSFGELYGPLFPSKGKEKGTDWKSAFQQQQKLLNKVGDNATLSKIKSFSLEKDLSYEKKVGTVLDNIKNNRGIGKDKQRS